MIWLFWVIIVGLIAGFLAGKIMKGSGYGTLGDIVLGILGGVVGGWLLRVVGVEAGGLIGEIIVATIGAVVLVAVARMLKKA